VKRNISKGIRRNYDANFKITVLKHAEQSNNCEAARKYSVSEANVRRWKQQKQQFTNVNCTRKLFRGPKHGRFHEAEEQVVQFVHTER
jgi:transposase-like protein